MMDVLLLRFDAPLQSFGGIAVDENGVCDPFPGTSLLTGLVANALGLEHRDSEALERLQQRLRFAVRRDHPGERLVDFQTVDMTQPHLQTAWTTTGSRLRRGGAGVATHIRYRHYWADAVFTIGLTLDPSEEAPGLDTIEQALLEPERPLFLGRKCCLPSTPLGLGRVSATSLLECLRRVPADRSRRSAGSATPLAAWWPVRGEPEPSPDEGHLIPVFDRRDWRNQVHTGRRLLWEGQIEVEPEELP